MPRRKPAPPASRHLRRAIASAAARLMAEDGITDYSMAKRKAARSMGAENGEALPTNEEIQAELRAYQAIYQEDEQAARVHALRQTALNAMQLLNEFQPRLTGAVLDGTAGRYSPIHLQLFADCSKDVEIWLLSNNIVFKSSTLARKSPTGAEDQFVLDLDDTTILLDIFPPKNQHRQPVNQSMAAAEVQTLLVSPISLPSSPPGYGIS
ncbi:MAG: nucleotidyltransferase [Rugosibacter sp.]